VTSRDDHNRQAVLDRPQLRNQRVQPPDEPTGDEHIDLHSAHHVERLAGVVGAEHAMPGVAKDLLDQLLYRNIPFQHENGRTPHRRHGARLPVRRRGRQTQMG